MFSHWIAYTVGSYKLISKYYNEFMLILIQIFVLITIDITYSIQFAVINQADEMGL